MAFWIRNVALTVADAFTPRSRHGVRVILMYHSVGKASAISVAAWQLKEQLQMLQERFQIVTLNDLVDDIPDESAPRNIAAITFDDGYRDNYTQALPILEGCGVRATFFVCSGLLAKQLTIKSGARMPLMSKEEVRDIAGSGHQVGAHTRTHAILPHLDAAAASDEIRGSRVDLEDTLGMQIRCFAYPKGRYNTAIRQLVADSGFDSAVGVEERLVSRRDDRYTLPRIGIHGALTRTAFRAKVSRSLETYQLLKRLVTRRDRSKEVRSDVAADCVRR